MKTTCKYRILREHLTKKDHIFCQIRVKNYPLSRKCTRKCNDYVKKLTLKEQLQNKNKVLTDYMKENPSLKVQTRGMVRPCKWCARMKENEYMHCLHCGSKLK